ncbi:MULTISPECIES: DUF6279 family lipoprotein [Vibrio]|uniref:DUF6279 family lipoprotein n=1 Tax=Vibrio TaxID=662 RepID=UPI000C9E1117|nr:DUF6279 family lipoprotein [Vibrio diazotrophicus]MCZ4372904.1 DUF6279 family lipoprotein [Vibrio diazotrophicus]PNH81433.1 hypothetical protein C1N27_07780 [Vibrio diazotrophicus]
MKKRITLLLMSVLLIAGCSTKFVYHNMDWFILEYLDDYVTLTDQQESLVKTQIDALSQWHQTEELNNYVMQFDQLLELNPKTLTLEQLQQHREWIYEHYQSLVTQIFPSIFPIATALSDKQVDEFMQGLAKRHQKYADKYADLNESETRAKYEERIIDRMEQWLGSLTADQEQLAGQWAKALQITTYDWIAFQKTQRNEIQSLLNQRHNQTDFNQRLQKLLFSQEESYSPVLKAKLNYNEQASNEYILSIVHLSTPKQIEHFKETVFEWRSLASDLHAAKR